MLSFSVKCSLCQYLYISYHDCSLSNKTITNGYGVSYQWSANNNGKVSITVTEGGIYSVTVTDNDNHCYTVTSVSVTKDVAVPTISIPDVEQIDCTTQTQTISVTYTITNAMGVSYKWSAHDNGTSSITVTEGGTYSVTVTDNDNHCETVTSVNVEKDITKPIVVIPDVPQVDCATQTQYARARVTVTNTAGVSYEWSKDNVTDANLAVSEAGVYTVTVTDNDNHCFDTASVTVTKNIAVPVVEILPVEQINCTTQTQTINVTYTITNGDGVSYRWSDSVENKSSMTTSDGGVYSVTITDNNNHCEAMQTVSVMKDVQAPAVKLTTDYPILNCATLSIVISAENAEELTNGKVISSYNWSDN